MARTENTHAVEQLQDVAPEEKDEPVVQYFKVVIPSQLTALLQSVRDKKNLAKLYAKAQRMANE